MNTQRTYTFQACNTGFYAWMPRITVECGRSRPIVYIPSEASYKRFVRLANSGHYQVAVADAESVAWTLSRKPQLAFLFDWNQFSRQTA